jgi:hypothetical protein
LAYGGSGRLGTIQRVSRYLEKLFRKDSHFENLHPDDVRKTIVIEISKVMRDLFVNQYVVPEGQRVPTAGFLFAGHTTGGPVLFQVT